MCGARVELPRKWNFWATRVLSLVVFVAVTACGSNPAVPNDSSDAQQSAATRNKPSVSEQSVPLRAAESPSRTVVHGDTLYSIAWETGRDYRELAKWNHIPSPYTIKPGQVLRVSPPPVEKATATPAKPTAKTSVANKSDSKSTVSTGKTIKPVAVAAPKPTPVNIEKGKPKSQTQTKSKPEPAKTPSSSISSVVAGKWVWPADGQILKRYSDSDSGKGLDIGGVRGQPIRASAGGRVVYQGSGLRGYGQLIIIKHSDEFLSAYAHNDRIYVKEGDVVKRGQKIAEMGSTGTDRVKLHFEIRRQGVPTDPLKYLPIR
jgi:lipoprotein NlpD